MDIRKAKKDEIAQIADMTRQLFEDELSDMSLSVKEFETRLQSYIETGCEPFLLIDNDIVGYAFVNLRRNPYYLVDFFIHRQFRRCGMGTKAFYQMLDHLNVTCIDLVVFCWNNRGRKFWETLALRKEQL